MLVKIPLETLRKALASVPEGATGYSYLEDDEYNHFVILTPELSALNKHKYWHVDGLSGIGRWELIPSNFAGYNMLEFYITIEDMRKSLEEMEAAK